MTTRLRAMEDAVARVASAVSKLAEAGGSADRTQVERIEAALSSAVPRGGITLSPQAQALIQDYALLRRALGVPTSTDSRK